MIKFLVKLFHRFLKDNSGAAAIEYCVIAVGISVAIIVSVNDIGTKLITIFFSLGSATWHVESPPY
jgi:pilus assembly protein Flp/PilA